ncbi:unnamed protein product [Peniophora sp. CBMAI 1063]|nr:unnamed protein product [Peniophora sp. CBMAI 1063]
MLSFKGAMRHGSAGDLRRTILRIDAPNVEHLCINVPTDVVRAKLRTVRLQSGFGNDTEGADYGHFLEEWRDTLEEVQIDRLVGAGWRSDFSWQRILSSLNHGSVQILRLFDTDGVTPDELHGPWLDLPDLRVCITASLLKFKTPPSLIHAEVCARTFQELHPTLDGYTRASLLNVEFTERTAVCSHSLFTGEMEFYSLRSLIVSSTLDGSAMDLLDSGRFPQLLSLDVQTRITAENAEERDFHQCTEGLRFITGDNGGLFRPLELAESAKQRGLGLERSFIIDRLRRRLQSLLDGPAALIVRTSGQVGNRSQCVTFSLVDEIMQRCIGTTAEPRHAGLHLSTRIDELDWCRCTLHNGYDTSALRWLAAVALPNVNSIRMTLDLREPRVEMPSRMRLRRLDTHSSISPDTDWRGPRCGFWTLLDALAPVHKSSASEALLNSLRMMPGIERLEIQVVRSRNYTGVSLLRAIIEANRSDDNLYTDAPILAALSTVVLMASRDHKSMPIAHNGSKLWAEILALATIRRRLSDAGRCPALSVILSGNFCVCKTPLRDAVRIRELKELVSVSIVPIAEGCTRCGYRNGSQ